MDDPYDWAVERLEQDLTDGLISEAEYREEMRAIGFVLAVQHCRCWPVLHGVHRQEAEEAARDVLETYGYYDRRADVD